MNNKQYSMLRKNYVIMYLKMEKKLKDKIKDEFKIFQDRIQV